MILSLASGWFSIGTHPTLILSRTMSSRLLGWEKMEGCSIFLNQEVRGYLSYEQNSQLVMSACRAFPRQMDVSHHRHSCQILRDLTYGPSKTPIYPVFSSSNRSLNGLYLSIHVYKHTSSTAQGGGGSSKNRKPIGEIGCCESGMAERIHWWTERCLISLTLSLSFSAYLPTYLLTYLPTYLSIFYLSI